MKMPTVRKFKIWPRRSPTSNSEVKSDKVQRNYISNSALDGIGDVIPRDECDAGGGPQVNEPDPEVGLEYGRVLVADADTDGRHGGLPAVVHLW